LPPPPELSSFLQKKTFGLRRTVNVYVIVTLVNFCITLEFLLAHHPKIALPSLEFKSGYVPET